MSSQEKYLAAFTAAYDAFSKAIYRHCYFRVLDAELAQDLLQETFVRVWQYMSEGKDVKNMRAFLYRTANNAIIDDVRKKKRYPLLSLDVLQEAGFEPGYDPRPATEREQGDAELRSVLSKLKQPYRDLLIMRYLDGLAPCKIAVIRGNSVAVISVQLNRGIRKMRSMLKNTQCMRSSEASLNNVASSFPQKARGSGPFGQFLQNANYPIC